MGSRGAVNSPPAPVFTVRTTALLSVLVMVTVALGTTAPCGSFTVPAILPVISCAIAAHASQQQSAATTPKRNNTRILLLQFVIGPAIRTSRDLYFVSGPNRIGTESPLSNQNMS